MVVQYCQTYTDREDNKVLTYDLYSSYTVRKKDLRIAQTVRTENGFTDRTNRTVREKDSRIVNMVSSRLKSQVVPKWNLEKFVDPYGSYRPYELKMASRIVRTVRFVKRIYGSWI